MCIYWFYFAANYLDLCLFFKIKSIKALPVIKKKRQKKHRALAPRGLNSSRQRRLESAPVGFCSQSQQQFVLTPRAGGRERERGNISGLNLWICCCRMETSLWICAVFVNMSISRSRWFHQIPARSRRPGRTLQVFLSCFLLVFFRERSLHRPEDAQVLDVFTMLWQTADSSSSWWYFF